MEIKIKFSEFSAVELTSPCSQLALNPLCLRPILKIPQTTSDGMIDTGVLMLRHSFQTTIASHIVLMLVSKRQYHVIDDV